MNTFKLYVPSFLEIESVAEIEFETTEDLLALEQVQVFAETKTFFQFCMSNHTLMVLYDEGYYWWVVGYIKDPSIINLPQWEGVKYRNQDFK